MTRGELGEQTALEFLTQKGFKIIEKNYHTKYGEIDIIMCDEKYLIFVEVKLRKNDRYGKPSETVTFSKRRKIIMTASEWLAKSSTEFQPRFDVVEVYMSQNQIKPHKIVHIENAFDAFDV